MLIGVFRRGLALARERAVIAVQGLGYVTAHNWAYIAPFGAAACLSLLAGAALGPGFFFDQELDCWHGMILTAQPVLDEPLWRGDRDAG